MPDPRDQVTLNVGNTKYGGWTSIAIKRGLEQLCGSFDVAVTERWPNQVEERPIRAGDRCAVAIGGEVVVTGWIDAVRTRYDAHQHVLRFSGRDAACDLVDCSAPLGQFNGQKLGELVQHLAKPYGIQVTLEIEDVEIYEAFTFDPGETVFDAIEKAARAAAALVVSDGRGGLVITRASRAQRVPDRLELGRNIVEADGLVAHYERYSQVTVLGQRNGNDFLDPEDTTSQIGRANDYTMRRHRPLIVISETVLDSDADLQRRAEWEVRHREGRCRRAIITVHGWRHAGGGLWQPNTLVPVRDRLLGIEREMLVVAVEFILDDQGTHTVLTLTDRAAFDLIPIRHDPFE